MPIISPDKIRRIILEQSKRANVGHIGSSLSIADIIAALYSGILRIPGDRHPERDRFILSKGHAALALYAALSLRGWLTADQLNSYCTDNSLLGVHPERDLAYIDFSTGSLGFGLTMGLGAALAARMQKSPRRIFVLVSDAELDEGSFWEAVMFAGQHKMSNLIVILDKNNQQALNYTKNVIDLDPLTDKFSAFGWGTTESDGHNIAEMTRTINGFDTVNGKPHILIAHTIFGKGVSFMQNQIKWHYWPMSEEEYQIALRETGGGQ